MIDAQELNLDVTINTPQLKTADPKVFNTLENAIQEFYNNTVWTEEEYEPFERIEGALQINITDDISSSTFVCDMYLSVSRPVYKSNYYSQLINHVDKGITFSYAEFDPLYNNTASFSDNLSAILTFYAYIIIGLDSDSFSPYGGETYYQIAQNIVSAIPTNVTNTDKSWTALGGERNRYWLINNFLNPRMRNYRLANYEYHRQGLDVMYDDTDAGKANMLGALKSIGDVNKTFPNSMAMQVFSDTKRQELIEIFSGASSGERRKVYDIMTKIDPSKASEFSTFR